MSPQRIALADLLAVTKREPRDLWDLRRNRLFPFEPERTRIPGRRGSASNYTTEALDYLQRLADVQWQYPRKSDEWFWCMWLDPADWPVDMRAWVLARLDRMLNKTMRAKAAGAVLEPGAERQVVPSAGRVRNRKSRRAASDWMLAWALGNERPDLYSAAPQGIPEPSFFDLLLKLSGPLFAGLQVPRAKGQREQISKRGGPYFLAHFRRIVALAPDRDIEQARRDWRAISHLIESVERVDWNKAPDLTPVGARPEPPSWTARKARRIRGKPAPDFIRQPIEEWRRSSDYRTLLFSALLTARRLFSRLSMPQVPDLMLGIAQQWLEGLPQVADAEKGRAHARR